MNLVQKFIVLCSESLPRIQGHFDNFSRYRGANIIGRHDKQNSKYSINPGWPRLYSSLAHHMAEDAGSSKNKSRRGGLEGTGVPLPINFHGNLVSAHNDSELSSLIQQNRTSKWPAVVSYGACWCHICKQMLPTFCNLSNDHPSTLFIYADIDECPEETKDIRYTPTFSFYQNGAKVDEFYGAGAQRLRDRVWLHS